MFRFVYEDAFLWAPLTNRRRILKYLLPVVISAIAFNINRFLESTFYYGTEPVSLGRKTRTGKRTPKYTGRGKRQPFH